MSTLLPDAPTPRPTKFFVSFVPFCKTSSMRQLVQAVLLVLISLSARAQTADAQLESFYKKYLDEHFALRPLEATSLGDHRFDRELEDVSKASREKWKQHERDTLRALKKEVPYKQLSRAAQIDYEIFQHDLEQGLWSSENFKPFEEDPRVYGGFINDSIYSLLTQSTLPKETNVSNAIARMAKIPDVITAARANLTHPPKQLTETAIRQNKGAINFYEKDLFELVGDSPQLPAMKAAAAPIASALHDYQNFLEKELLPRSTGDWRIGKAKFAKKLEMVLDAGMSADQVFADAEREFTRVENEMYVVSRQLWSHYFAQKPLPPDDLNGRP